MYAEQCAFTTVISQRLLQDNEACYKNNFSCGDPVVELIERAARIVLTVSNVILQYFKFSNSYLYT